jgi:predicted nucleotidyltransferase
MKKIWLIIGFVCFQSFSAQNIMDFDLKNVELQGMKPARINQEMKNIGITKMPFVTSDPNIIAKVNSQEWTNQNHTKKKNLRTGTRDFRENHQEIGLYMKPQTLYKK